MSPFNSVPSYSILDVGILPSKNPLPTGNMGLRVHETRAASSEAVHWADVGGLRPSGFRRPLC